MGRVFNFLVRVLAVPGIQDTQCGFKCFTQYATQKIFQRATIDGFAFDVEALVLAQRLGLKTVDVPVRWLNSPLSKVTMFRHPTRMLLDLIRIRWNDLRGRYRP